MRRRSDEAVQRLRDHILRVVHEVLVLVLRSGSGRAHANGSAQRKEWDLVASVGAGLDAFVLVYRPSIARIHCWHWTCMSTDMLLLTINSN